MAADLIGINDTPWRGFALPLPNYVNFPSGVPAIDNRPRPDWCTYCHKTDHTDATCWCTRAVR